MELEKVIHNMYFTDRLDGGTEWFRGYTIILQEHP